MTHTHSFIKPPIIIRRGPQGFGFTIRAIRVYFGDSDFYTVHHIVMDVDERSPAFDSGIRPGDLITHINGELIQGLFHTQVVTLLMSSPEHISLRSQPLNQTSIKPGGRKRNPGASKLAKRAPACQRSKQKKNSEKRRKHSLIRKINQRRVPTDFQMVTTPQSAPVISPDFVPQFSNQLTGVCMATGSRCSPSLSQTVSSQEGLTASPTLYRSKSPHSPPTQCCVFSTSMDLQ
ncbi:unnamed protein product, partial [Meganyctiphanes norvegica]